MGNKMTNSEWKKIDEFQSFEEYEQFKKWIMGQVSLNKAYKEEVQERYSGAMMREELWFKHPASGAIWRLVEPDPPFYGVFEPVTLFRH